MSIGFSSLVCPDWDFDTIVTQAKALGFDGIELRGLRGDFELPLVSRIAADTDEVRRRLDDEGVELVCLSPSATLDSRKRRARAEQRGEILEYIELAARLGCPFVKLFAGEVRRFDTRQDTLARVAESLASLVGPAGASGVTLLLENGGDFPGSADLWYVCDAVSHPALKCCWNACNARVVGERPTTSVPRLAAHLGMVHVSDAEFDDAGILLKYVAPGGGDVEIDRQIELLKGIVYDGALIFEWPKAWVPSLPRPEDVLPDVAKFLRGCVEARQAVLSAYKGDKNPARFTSGPTTAR